MPVSVNVPSKGKADSYKNEVESENDDTTDMPDNDYGGMVAFSPEEYLKYVAVATALMIAHEKINSNPNTWNSVSEAIVVACQTFKTKVAEYLPLVLKAAGAGTTTAGMILVSSTNVNAKELQSAMDDFTLALEVYYDEDTAAAVGEAVQSGDVGCCAGEW